MPTSPHNSQLRLIAGDIGQGLQHPVQILFVTATILLIVGAALQEYEISVTRAKVSEALMLVSTARVDLVAYRAEYGRSPVDAAQAGIGTLVPLEDTGRYVSTLALRENGAIDVTVNLDEVRTAASEAIISFRIGLSVMDAGAPTIFTCGAWKPPPGFRVAGLDETSVPPKFLPYMCKEH